MIALIRAYRGRVLVLVGAIATALVPMVEVQAETATPAEMQRVCQNWLAYTVFQEGSWAGQRQPQIVDVQPLVADDGTLLAQRYSIAPSGYVVVPILKELPPVKAYSEEYGLDVAQTGGPTQLLRDMLLHRIGLYIQVYGNLDASQPATGDVLFDRTNRTQWGRFDVEPQEFQAMLQGGAMRDRTTVGPLLTTAWHQGAPYNNFCPMGDGGRCAVGCVATAAAQVLRYHRWPPAGQGSHSYTWDGDQSCDGNAAGGTLSVDFSDAYDWANMPSTCAGVCTQGQQAALAKLCFEVGIAYEMDYGVCSSGATTSDALTVLPTFFRYSQSINRQDRADHTPTTWFQIIQEEINADRPIIYRIFSHSIVCDGWQDTGGLNQYHMNYGWAEGHTTWYALDNLYCPWAGCDLNEEYLIRKIKPVSAGIVAWGLNGHGQCNVPPLNTGFVAVAGGGEYSLGLKADGSILAWGYNDWGQCNVAAPNSGFVAVAAGQYHGLGLKRDGSVVAWGYNAYGQCIVPAPNSGFVAVAGGESHSLGLKGDGSIAAWGNNNYGQCSVPAPNSGFVGVAGGWYHSLGLKADGSIVAWGYNGYGQCNVPAPNTGFVAVAGGVYRHSLGLKADGSIVAWGDNYYGQCNVPAPNAGFVAVAGGGADLHGHSLGLKADGSIVAWGHNVYGECDVPAPNTGFVGVAGGGRHSLGLKVYPGGDLNCDGVVNGQDIDGFVLSLFDPAGYGAQYPDCNFLNGDMNSDGLVNGQDIDGFVAVLFGG